MSNSFKRTQMHDVYNTHKKKQKRRQIIIKKAKYEYKTHQREAVKCISVNIKRAETITKKEKMSKGSVYGRDCLGGVGKAEDG